MGTIHKLREAAPAPVLHPRPYELFYYSRYSRGTPTGGWDKKSRAGSPRGAILAAVKRCLDRRAGMVLIHGLSGSVIATVFRRGSNITIIGPTGE